MNARVLIAMLFVFLLVAPAGASQKGVAAAIKEYLKERFSPYGVEVVVDDVLIRGDLGGVEFDSVKIKSQSTLRAGSKIPLYVTLLKDGLVVRRVWASAKVRLFMDVVVAKRTLKVRDVVGPEDVVLERREVRRLGEGLIGSLDEVVGMVVRRPLTGGRPIKRDYLMQPSVVKRGDVIEVVATARAIRIKTRALALQEGHPGEFINAKTSTGKILHGRVTPDGRLLVVF